MSPKELDELMRGEDDEENYRLYVDTNFFYFATFQQAKREAEKHMVKKAELRIEVLIETEGVDFWAFEYETSQWVPS